MNEKYLIVTTTVSNESDAVDIARQLISCKLARCVQILPRIRSIYHWDGEICDDDEYLLLIKTAGGNLNDLMRLLPEWHPYEVPEILAIPLAAGYEPYLKWLDEWRYNQSP